MEFKQPVKKRMSTNAPGMSITLNNRAKQIYFNKEAVAIYNIKTVAVSVDSDGVVIVINPENIPVYPVHTAGRRTTISNVELIDSISTRLLLNKTENKTHNFLLTPVAKYNGYDTLKLELK